MRRSMRDKGEEWMSLSSRMRIKDEERMEELVI